MAKIIREKQDMTYLNWTLRRNSSGTAGSFLKSYSELNGKKTYYKLSNYDSIRGIIGHECVNEIIADRLLTILKIPHLEYSLIHADIVVDDRSITTWLCASDDFKDPGDSKVALDVYYQLQKEQGEDPLSFCKRMGWAEQIYNMFLIDFLILNRDRHGANLEILKTIDGKLRLAPLFDHGLSLTFSCYEEDQLHGFDVMEDKMVQSFVGTRSPLQNLRLIPLEHFGSIGKITPEHRSMLFQDMEGIISKERMDIIWDMIWKRWCYYEDLCHQK